MEDEEVGQRGPQHRPSATPQVIVVLRLPPAAVRQHDLDELARGIVLLFVSIQPARKDREQAVQQYILRRVIRKSDRAAEVLHQPIGQVQLKSHTNGNVFHDDIIGCLFFRGAIGTIETIGTIDTIHPFPSRARSGARAHMRHFS